MTIRRLIILFWVFIGGMLIWQFYNYNQSINQDVVAHPEQEHYFFNHTNGATGTAPATPAHSGANVQQVGYSVSPNKPGVGSFTAHVTLKNTGDAKATSIQIWVRPYRGISMGDEDVGRTDSRILSDNDPLAQYGDWVSFSDLDPGATDTRDVVFTTRPSIPFGANPTPQITFESEKKP